MRKNQNYTVDLGRLVMAFGVIALHVRFDTRAAEYYNLIFWPIAVPFFYVSSLTYFVTGLGKLSVTAQAKKTFSRLVLPYLCWTIIYVCLFVGKDLATGHSRHYEWWRILLYGESSIQLYFVPTLLCFQTLVLGIHLLLNQQDQRLVGIGLITISALYLIIGDIYDCFGVSHTGQYFGIILYLAAAFFLAPKVKEVMERRAIAIAGLLITALAIVSNVMGITYSVLDYPLVLPIGGIGLFMFCVGMPTLITSEKINQLTSTSFGIYLSHVVFLEAFEFIIDKGFHNQLKFDFWIKTVVICAIFVISIVFVNLIRRFSTLRMALFGEK